jgi:outer membrane protein OmpA-like peptidoglycan-associated protein
VLSVSTDGTMRGVRATGAAAFRTYAASKNLPGSVPRCTPPPARLGCGATIHAVPFAADGVTLVADPTGALPALVEGLRAETARTITVESYMAAADGAPAELQALTERRAHAVVAELVRQGIAAERLRAAGAGAARPLAAADDEASRSINRRFEIRCQ